MSTFPVSPRLLKAGFVLIDPDTLAVLQVITLQYNPDTRMRTLKIKGAEEGGYRSEALRLRGPPVETFKLDEEIDATDQLEQPDQNPNTVAYGIFPQFSALETLVYPARATLQNNFTHAQQGTPGNHAHARTIELVRMEREPRYTRAPRARPQYLYRGRMSRT